MLLILSYHDFEKRILTTPFSCSNQLPLNCPTGPTSTLPLNSPTGPTSTLTVK